MQRKQAVTIKLNPTIVSIFEDYEDVRPHGLEQSYTLTSNTHQEKELVLEIPAEINDAFVAAELGANGGQTGMVAAVAHAGIKVGIKKLIEYFKGKPNETLYANNLEYLKEKTFNDNKHLIEGDYFNTIDTITARKNTLQKLYDYAFNYQKLKGTRFGFRLFGFTFGEYRDDNVIDDPKYLVNIFIGRKLMLAAKAESFESYKNHLTHLRDFLDKIVKRHEIFKSSSDDTKYLSLRTMANMVRKDLLNQEITESVDNSDVLAQLDADLKRAETETDKLLKSVQERTTSLVCDPLDLKKGATPDEFRLICDNLAPSLNLVTKFNNSPQLAMLKKVLYQNKKINDKQLETFVGGMKDYNGVSLNEAAKKDIKDKFKALIDNKTKLQNLFSLLKQARHLNALNPSAYLEISDKLIYLLNEIKQTQFALVKAQRAFVDGLATHYYQSATANFKDQFTEHGYKRLLVDIKPTNDAIITLEEINLNKNKMASTITAKTEAEFKKFTDAVVVPGAKAEQPQDRFEAESDIEDDKALKEWVLVNLNSEAREDNPKESDYTKFVANVPEDIKELPWYKKMFTDAELRRKNAALEAKNKKLEEKIAASEKSNSEKDTKITQLNGQVTTLTNNKETLEEEKKEALDANKVLSTSTTLERKIQNHRVVFVAFIEDYIKNNDKTSPWSFFKGHYHGKDGQNAAKHISFYVNKMFDELILEARANIQPNEKVGAPPLSLETLNTAILHNFQLLLTIKQHFKQLNGNFNPHSLKTYLLAYANYLSNPVDVNVNDLNPVVTTFHRDKFVNEDPNKIERQYYKFLIKENANASASMSPI